MKKLTELGGRFTDKVSLKARELLIHCHLPSYEERHAQMEQILKAAVIESHYGDDGYDYRSPSYDSLKELIDTRFCGFCRIFFIIKIIGLVSPHWKFMLDVLTVPINL